MSFSIDCLTPHPPSPSKRLIHSRRFALSERGSRLPHAPAPRSRRQPRVGKPAQGTSSRRGGVIHRSYPQACAGVCGFVECRHWPCAQDLFETSNPSERSRWRLPTNPAASLGASSLWTEFWLKIGENHPISRVRPEGARRRHPDGRDSIFFIIVQPERGHCQAVRTRSRAALSKVLHRPEADLWITWHEAIRLPPLMTVRRWCHLTVIRRTAVSRWRSGSSSGHRSRYAGPPASRDRNRARRRARGGA